MTVPGCLKKLWRFVRRRSSKLRQGANPSTGLAQKNIHRFAPVFPILDGILEDSEGSLPVRGVAVHEGADLIDKDDVARCRSPGHVRQAFFEGIPIRAKIGREVQGTSYRGKK